MSEKPFAGAAARVRREAGSVHHALCDLRRPAVGPPKCTCRMADVGAALADLLDVLHRAADEEPENDPADVVHGWAEMQALEAAITREIR